MDEFKEINWKPSGDLDFLEIQVCSFVPEELLLDSYIYQHLKKSLPKENNLGVTKEKQYVPGEKYKFPCFKRSLLTKQEQEHCLIAMKLLKQNSSSNQMSLSDKYSLEKFNKLTNKLAEENKAFIELAKKSWESDRLAISRLKNNLFRYGWKGSRNKFERYLEYGKFYREKDLISIVYNEDVNVTIELNCIKNLLELGTLAKFSCPSLKVECRLSAQTLPEEPCTKKLPFKLPVSQDKNIRNLIQENNIDVVISSSGLSRLLDNTDLNAKWTIPVKIELIDIINGNDKYKNKVVFIDKPFVSDHQDPLDLKYYSMKRLVKTNFCQYEAFSFEEQKPIPNFVDNSGVLQTERTEDVEQSKVNKEKPNIVHQNASYRLWKFKKTVNNNKLLKNPTKNKELNLLVRTKLDACEINSTGNLQPLIIKPKIELQLQYGANIPTKSELSREWTSLFFRPFSNLYRVRMHWDTAEVIDIEKCSLQKINVEANSLYQYNPLNGLGMLNNLLTKLVELDNGNYLMIHQPKHQFFISLLVECENSDGNLDLTTEYEQCQIDTEIITRNWIPLDLNYILPINNFEKRPPGCFPFKKKFSCNSGKGKIKRNKKTL